MPTDTTMPAITGAITVMVNVTEYSSSLSSISVGDNESSYAYLLDSTGTIVYHPTTELIGTRVDISQYNADAITINDSLGSIHNGIDALNTNMQHITGSVVEINTMINEASEGVIDVSVKNTDIVALSTDTYNMVKLSTDYASSLQEIVDKFKL